jgi:hypothetical protein
VPRKKKQLKSAAPYLQRTLENDRVLDNIGDAVAGLQKAYRRAARGGVKAVDDKKLYEEVRRSAAALRAAVDAVQAPPPKPRRRGRVVMAAVVLAAAGGLAARKRASGPSEPLPAS